MEILFPKEQKVCGTCTYWNGSKVINGGAIKIDFTSYGICEHPHNSHSGQRLEPSCTCLKYILNPALKLVFEMA
jgi:hypothetical protein